MAEFPLVGNPEISPRERRWSEETETKEEDDPKPVGALLSEEMLSLLRGSPTHLLQGSSAFCRGCQRLGLCSCARPLCQPLPSFCLPLKGDFDVYRTAQDDCSVLSFSSSLFICLSVCLFVFVLSLSSNY